MYCGCGRHRVQLAPLVQAMREGLLGRRVLHADEMPVAMLKPGLGKTHRAYLWSYCTMVWDEIDAVVFDFAESRAGRHARRLLGIDEAASESRCAIAGLPTALPDRIG